MATKLKTPALVIALIVVVLIVFVEIGGSLDAIGKIFDGLGQRIAQIKESAGSLGAQGAEKVNSGVDDFKGVEGALGGSAEKSASYGVAALITIDVMLLFTLTMFNLPLIVSPRLVAQLQGILTLLVGIGVILFALFTLLKTLAVTMVMVGLLLAIPFGTIVYMVKYASFDLEAPAAIIASLMLLKVILSIALVVAHELFLKNVGLVLLIATSIVAMIIVTFLHNIVPVFLASITDGIAGIVVAVIAIVWGIVLVIGGLVGTIKSIIGLKSQV